MFQYLGDVLTIWIIVFAILITLVMCSLIVHCSLQNDTKTKRSEENESPLEETKLL